MNRNTFKDFLFMDSSTLGDTNILHLTTVYKWADKLFDEIEKPKEIYVSVHLLDKLNYGGSFTHTFEDGTKIKLQGSVK